MVKGVAQHFIDKGKPVAAWELVNEPDGRLNVTNFANTFNVVAQALKSVDPSYKLGGRSESWYHQDDMQTFFRIAGQNIGFVSWHQYVEGSSGSKSDQQVVNDAMGMQGQAQAVRAQMRAAGIPDSVPLFLGEYNVDGGDYNDPVNANMVGAIAAAATTYGMIHSNANFTMGALWNVQNDSAYSVFGHQGSYQVDPVGVVLADLTATMPGNMVQTTMPSNTPGLVGYTTTDNGAFSSALINTNLSQGYTVDLSKSSLPTTGLYRVEVSAANPKGSRTALTDDLSHVSVAAGSVVIVTSEAPHGGTEVNGTTSTAPASAGTSDPNTTPPVTSGSTPGAQPATGTGTGTAGTTAADPGKAAPTTTASPTSGADVASAATSAGNPIPASTDPSGSGTGGTTTSSAAAVQPAASTGTAPADPGSTSPSSGATIPAPSSPSSSAAADGTSGSSATATATGQFSVANGQIVGPDGTPFIAHAGSTPSSARRMRPRS